MYTLIDYSYPVLDFVLGPVQLSTIDFLDHKSDRDDAIAGNDSN